MSPLPLNATVCILSARRFGDAIMNASILKQASEARPDINWIIWTKPEFAPLFKLIGFNKITTAEFPIAGGAPKVLKGGWISLMKSIIQLRKLQIDASIDFIGDARESFLGMLISGGRHYSPKWDSSHWMHQLIWHAPIPLVNYLPIESSEHQVYEFVPALLSTLLGTRIDAKTKPLPLISVSRIAFHPYSSQAFKQWPTENWLSLAKALSKFGITPTILCSLSEKDDAHRQFGRHNTEINIVDCESIEELIVEIKRIDLLIGVDSFLVHLASALDKKTIVINAGNLPEWWVPPNSIALGQSGGCPHYPCSNEPSCLGKANESACIRSISPEQVMEAIKLELFTQSSFQ